MAFGVCFVGASLTTVRVRPRAAITSVLAALVVTGGAVAFTTREAGELTIAAIQGGVPRPELPPLEQIAKVLDNHIQQTMRTDLAGVDLVVWPESAAMDDPLHNRD